MEAPVAGPKLNMQIPKPRVHLARSSSRYLGYLGLKVVISEPILGPKYTPYTYMDFLGRSDNDNIKMDSNNHNDKAIINCQQ